MNTKTAVTADQLDEVEASQLAPLLRRVVELVGISAALRLSQGCGGTQLWVPPAPDMETRCGKALDDMDALTRLCESELAGHWWAWPKADQILRQIRDTAIRKCELPVQEQALLFNLTRSQIYNIKGEQPDEINRDQQELAL